MSKKIFGFGFILLVVLVFGSFSVPTALAARKASVIISPSTAFTEQNLTYTYTFTNANDNGTTAGIGSIEIQLPTEFGTPSISILSVSSEKTWELSSTNGYENGLNLSTKKIGVNAVVGSGEDSDKLIIDEFIEIQITTTAPVTANSYEWTAFVWANLGFTGTPIFTLTSPQPTITVTAPIIPDPDPDPEGDPEKNANLLIEEDITLENHCTVEDTNGGTHTFPQDNSPSEYLAICAIAEMLERGFVNDVDFVDFGFGLFIDNFNNFTKPANSYWKFYVNTDSSNVGVAEAPVIDEDIVSFILTEFDPVTFAEQDAEPTQSIKAHIVELVLPTEETEEEPPAENTGGGGSGVITPAVSFNTANALTYLKSVQGTDGSFGDALLYTDWAAIAYGAGSVIDSSRDNLLDYLNAHNSISSLLTDNERRAMALMALGQNPYFFNGVNYIGAITSTFDGVQFGDLHEDNDDIFALIPLKNSGYTANDEMIVKDIAFIISAQRTDGSWDGSVDMTAAAIQALKPFDSVAGVTDALSKATQYLVNQQNNDGGWGNISSTSWTMQAMSALDASWNKNGKTGMDYLATQQINANNGGAVLGASESLQNKIWATSYAIPAGLLKPWSAIMKPVSKPVVQSGGGGGGVASSSIPNTSVNISSVTPQAIITNRNQVVNVKVDETVNGSINVSSLLSAGVANIPPVNITSTKNISVNIPATSVTSTDINWNGIINLPKLTTVTFPETAGELKTVSTAIEMGSDAQLSFVNAVRILFPGEAGKRTGFSKTGANFSEIINICIGDSQIINDSMVVNGECKIDVGLDLVIWTKHFTTFATYTVAPTIAPSVPESVTKTKVTTLTTNALSAKAKSPVSKNENKKEAPIELASNTEEINTDNLTALAVNTLPENTSNKTIFIVLGILSGIFLIYIASKFIFAKS